MKKTLTLLIFCIFSVIALFLQFRTYGETKKITALVPEEKSYWFVLHRKSNFEYLYFGKPGDKEKSVLLRTFKVKTGVPGEKPTPLPEFVGKKYWEIIAKYETPDNPETAPYFLTLNIPVTEEPPFGPKPYLECNGQCNWELPGAFGLHGNNGDPEKLADTNPGSSGCIRHTVEDITYLYNLLDLKNSQVRYYIDDV